MKNVSSSNSHEGLVPKLRFPDFQGEWKEIRFNELFTMLSNNTLSRAELSDNGNIYNMHYGDVLIKFGDTVSPYIDTIPYIADTSKIKNIGDFLQDGDIIIADTAEDSTVGKATEITEFRDKQVVSGLHTIPCRPSLVFSAGFLGYYLNSSHYHTQLIPLMQGIKVTSISKSNISQTLIRYPNIAEQKKISALIQLIDMRLRKQRELIEHLKSYKRGVLKVMFPQNGEDVPRVRFKGFTNDWEQRKVGELADSTFGGGTPNTSNTEFWNGDIPWIQSSDITEHQLYGVEPKKNITQVGLSKSATKLIPANSIAIVTRVGVGKLAVMPFEYTTSQDFLSLGNLKIDIDFGTYLLYRKMQSELNAVQGTSIKGVTKDELLKKDVLVPTRAEQEKIGTYFRTLDRLITLHQRKIDESERLKQILLNKLFI